MQMQRRLAPGARVTVRDEDWVIRRLDLSDDGGHALTCDGLSELVRGTSAIFLDRLEDDIQVHDPADTQLFQDTSDYFTDTPALSRKPAPAHGRQRRSTFTAPTRRS